MTDQSTIRLDGKTVVVTGAGRGLGRAIALGLIDAGATVLAADRDGDVLAELLAAAAGRPGEIRGHVLDLTDNAALDRFIADVLMPQTPDGLVNCAGIGQEVIRQDFATRPIPFYEVSDADWRRIFAVNAEAVFRLCRAVAPAMVARGSGRIVSVTTSLETMIRPGMSPYGPAKAASEALSAVMAKDLAGTGVTVNVVVPGGPARTRMMPGVPEDKLIAPEVMVGPVRYLLSDAAAIVTGRRFRAAAWKTDIPAAAAMAEAGAPLAWPGLAGGTAQNPLPV